MHFICSIFGSAGDVFPLLGLSLELRRRGHTITFATNEHFRTIVEKYGIEFEPLGTEEDYHACIDNPNLWNPRRAFRHVFQSLMPGLKRQYEIHVDRAKSGPTVGITNCFGFGALTAQDQLGIPVITVHLQPAVLWSRYQPPALPGLFGPAWVKNFLYRTAERFILDPTVCPFLNDWRRELGLRPIKQITKSWNSRSGILCMFPDWYAPKQPDWPDNLTHSDFPLWNHLSDQPLDPELSDFLARGDAPIVFTPGSANVHGKGFFQTAVETCRKEGRRGILLSGFPDQIPAGLSASIHYARYAPLDLLLPHASLFVHHGGIGSMSQAMLAGTPQIIMPLAHDQFDNADRVRKLNVGGSLAASRFSPSNLIPLVRNLIDNKSVHRTCQEVAGRLKQRDGLFRSAEIIERFIGVRNGSNPCC